MAEPPSSSQKLNCSVEQLLLVTIYFPCCHIYEKCRMRVNNTNFICLTFSLLHFVRFWEINCLIICRNWPSIYIRQMFVSNNCIDLTTQREWRIEAKHQTSFCVVRYKTENWWLFSNPARVETKISINRSNLHYQQKQWHRAFDTSKAATKNMGAVLGLCSAAQVIDSHICLFLD